MSVDLSPSARAALDAQYDILREVGRGGTAVVYLARERASGTEVAIKLIRSKFLDDEEALARFAREAQLVAQLQHPNIVPIRAVLDLGTSGVAIVMEHLTGRTLRQLLNRDGSLSPERVERIMRDIAGALDAAHAAGIIHRDVKPENIFVADEGRAVLADFGLARSMTADTALTMHGVTLGTPAYMSPEQIDGAALDARADIYSLGLVAWEMLSGRRPWDGESLYTILYHQKHEVLADVRDVRSGVPDGLAEVIARSIEKDRDARWHDMRDLLDALDATTQGQLVPFSGPNPTVAETMRFVRSTPETAPAVPPVPGVPASLQEWTALLEEPAPSRRRFPIVARVASGIAVLSMVVIITALVWGRSGAVPQQEGPMLGGDVRTPAALSPSIDSLAVVRRDTTASKPTVASPATTSVSNGATAPVTNSATAPRATAASSDTTAPPTMTPSGARSFSAAQRLSERIVTSIPSPTVAVPAGPRAVVSGSNIAAGGMHSCFISSAGRALCWGSNDRRQLGRSTEASAPSAVQSDVPFAAIAAGLSHSCAIARDGAAWCWGNNDRGQLGDGSHDERLTPVVVADAHPFRAITAGAAHTCGLDAYGVAWCWGWNARGQLGDSTTRDSAVPVNIAARRFVAIAAGWNFTCALAGSGQVSCWGDNSAGQLGDGPTSDRRVPVAVASTATFVSIAAGSAHACGVTSEGEAYCWGQNVDGQLGDGTNVNRATPVRVRAAAHFVSITAGGVHTCAVADDGAAFCWGRNTYGQLGTGRTADESLPTPVADGHTFASVRAFGSHTCGVTVAGEPFCWGYNLERQLGDGTRTHRTRPVRVELSGGR